MATIKELKEEYEKEVVLVNYYCNLTTKELLDKYEEEIDVLLDIHKAIILKMRDDKIFMQDARRYQNLGLTYTIKLLELAKLSNQERIS